MSDIKEILSDYKKIAMIGVSNDVTKASTIVMKYMQKYGFKVYPVNPKAKGQKILGEEVYEKITDIKDGVDIVDVFRPSNEALEIAKDTVKINAKVLWLQLGIKNEEAKKLVKENNIEYVEDRCTKMEYQKHFLKIRQAFPVLQDQMKKIFLIYGHYDDKSFNAAIRDTFIKTSKEKGNEVDIVDLYKEKFDPVFAGEEPDAVVLNHRKRIEASDTIVLIAPIWNFRMPAIVEGWIDKVLAPPWAFRFKQLWGNYGYPIGNLRDKKAIIFCTYGSPRLAITTFFLNLPIRRLKRGVFHMCGIYNINYRRYFAVPFVSEEKRKKFLEDVKKTALNI